MGDGLVAGDPDREVAVAILVRGLVSGAHAADDVAHASRRPIVFLEEYSEMKAPGVLRLA